MNDLYRMNELLCCSLLKQNYLICNEFGACLHKYKVKALPRSLFLRQYSQVTNFYSSSFILTLLDSDL